MSKFKYVIMNGDNVAAMVYEDEKWGRTIVIMNKIDGNEPLKVYNRDAEVVSRETEISEFLIGLLPI